MGENVRDCAYVVLVPVSYKYSADLVCVLYQIADIRYYKVDAQHFVIREAHSRIDDNHIVAVFKHSHILADFGKSAKRDYSKFRASLLCDLVIFHIYFPGNYFLVNVIYVRF